MELKNLKINFLGDSITEGAGTSGDGARYYSLIEKEYGLAAARGYGVGGARIAPQNFTEGDWCEPYNYCKRYVTMDDDADVVVVFGGTNDYGHGDVPLGRFEDREATSFYGACHVLIKGLIEKYPSSAIVFMTPTHRLGEDKVSTEMQKKPDVVYGTLKEYVNALKEVCEYYSIPVCDLWKTSGIQPSVDVLREKYMPDGLHPNDEGHKIIAKRLAGFLQTL